MMSKVSGMLVVALHNAHKPTPTEWDAHLALLAHAARKGGSLAGFKSLVFSDGGMPDSIQRKASTRLIDEFRGREMPVAIVSEDALARGIVTAGSWFGLHMRAFSPAELDKVFAYLAVPSAAVGLIRSDLDDLAASVSCQTYRSIRW